MKQIQQAMAAATSSGAVVSMHECQAGGVGVVRAQEEHHLVALRSLPAGEQLFRIEGERTSRPASYSVQIGEHLHIDVGAGHSAEEILDRYFWRYMNHSCDPNAFVCGRDVIAGRDIHPGEAVTFNYNTTEWDMHEGFLCRCGSPDCLGWVQGFKHLTPNQRERLHMVAPHLSRYAGGESRLTVESA